jgi:hypothetical protein
MTFENDFFKSIFHKAQTFVYEPIVGFNLEPIYFSRGLLLSPKKLKSKR